MRDIFPGYYVPVAEEIAGLWETAAIVVDTNVLLNLYEVSSPARNSLFDVLERLKDRVWIPHHVALEFQRRRRGVASKQRNQLEAAVKTAGRSISEIIQQVESNKRAADLLPMRLLDELREAHGHVHDALTKSLAEDSSGLTADPIRERLDLLFHGRIGAPIGSQSELDKIFEEGKGRYSERIPPGFQDSKKEDDARSTYVADGLRYESAYGDLLIWKQLLLYAKENVKKGVIFVTSDVKQDWWLKEKDEPISPHPELVAEARRVAGIESFWMYTLSDFLTVAPTYLQVKVSSDVIQDVREVEQQPISVEIRPIEGDMERSAKELFDGLMYAARLTRVVPVGAWLQKNYPTFGPSQDSDADFVSSDGETALIVVQIGRTGDLSGFNVKKVAMLALRYKSVVAVIAVSSETDALSGTRRAASVGKAVHELSSFRVKVISVGVLQGGVYTPYDDVWL